MEDVLMEKIQVLQMGTAEQQLVGLCLSTRLADDGSFAQLFEKYQLDFCRALLQDQMNPLYSRLVSQLIYRAAGCDESNPELILNTLGAHVIPSEPTETSEQWTALRVLLSRIKDMERIDLFLVEIWRTMQSSSQRSGKADIESDVESAQQLMNQTLAGLLDQTPIDCCSCKELFVENTIRIAKQKIPRFVELMLQEWTAASERDKQVYATILLFALQQCKQPRDSQTFKQNAVKLILACIVSVDKNDELRNLAWKTLLVVLHETSWDWMLTPDGGKLGNYTKLCVVLRMAVGEFKIQLGKQLELQTAAGDTTLMETSGQFIVEAIDFVVNQDTINVEAITHIHKSLGESLHCCIDYLDMAESEIVTRVFAKLLSEIDVFEGKNETALRALRWAMETSHYDSLLPALTAVFASAEGNSECWKVLSEYDLIACMPLFMERYWRVAKEVETIEWACQLIEMWVSVTTSSADKAKIQKSLIQYLERQPESKELSSIAGVSAALSCYAALQGSQPPGEPDASIIQTALERCA